MVGGAGSRAVLKLHRLWTLPEQIFENGGAAEIYYKFLKPSLVVFEIMDFRHKMIYHIFFPKEIYNFIYQIEGTMNYNCVNLNMVVNVTLSVIKR